MKWSALICSCVLIAALAVTLLIGGLTAPKAADAPTQTPELMASPTPVTPAPTATAVPISWGWDGDMEEATGDINRWVTVLLDDGLHWMRMNYYLYGVVAGEMPASFPEEALKAQAVAARTYTLYKQSHTTRAHPNAEVCGNSACCKAYASPEVLKERWGEDYEKNAAIIRAAVDDTDSLALTYEEAPILAVFHSTSSGMTERSADVWGGDLPYLQSVSSEGEEASPRYSAKVKIDAAECKQRLLEAYPKMKLSGSAKNWFKSIKRSKAGGVLSLKAGGVTLTGGQMRKLFGLNSSCFTISASKNSVTFETKGYGHGVGMSQYGARAMAIDGADFREILLWYYKDTVMTTLAEAPDV
ncbi:MAG: stage II sporulation protein D [Oscillospiraceae bacterium]|jgi:stage II sporulation protein D|nr:stage II sporulation protein D [Oscillospiraceae bacterium]